MTTIEKIRQEYPLEGIFVEDGRYVWPKRWEALCKAYEAEKGRSDSPTYKLSDYESEHGKYTTVLTEELKFVHHSAKTRLGFHLVGDFERWVNILTGADNATD